MACSPLLTDFYELTMLAGTSLSMVAGQSAVFDPYFRTVRLPAVMPSSPDLIRRWISSKRLHELRSGLIAQLTSRG